MGLSLLVSPVHARSVTCLLDLKFYEKQPGADADKFLGYTSSKKKRSVSVPMNDAWYVRPVGKWGEEDFFRLAREMRDFKIPGLDLSNRWDVNNETLAIFQDVYALKVLMLAQTKVTDAGMEGLEKLDHLGYLTVNGQITDSGLKHLSGLLTLQRLDLHGSKVTDKGLAALQPLKQLKSLDVSETAVTEKGLVALVGLPKLEAIYTSRRMTDQGMGQLVKFKALRFLDVTDAPISDTGVRALAQSAQLRELSLSGTQVSDEGLEALAHMKSLRLLDLTGSRVTPDGLGALAGLNHLETLSLSWDVLSEPEIRALGKLPRLKQVVLNDKILTQDTLARIHSMSRLSKPKSPTLAPVEEKPIRSVHAPAAKPVPVLTPEPLQERKHVASKPVPVWVPGDLTPTASERNAISLEGPKGKGMEIEVAAAPSRGRTGSGAMSGLKRIHQAEILRTAPDPDLVPGESRTIHHPVENASNSLGEINVNAR